MHSQVTQVVRKEKNVLQLFRYLFFFCFAFIVSILLLDS